MYLEHINKPYNPEEIKYLQLGKGCSPNPNENVHVKQFSLSLVNKEM